MVSFFIVCVYFPSPSALEESSSRLDFSRGESQNIIILARILSSTVSCFYIGISMETKKIILTSSVGFLAGLQKMDGFSVCFSSLVDFFMIVIVISKSFVATKI